MRSVWPSQSDYIIALQDPATAFTDPALTMAVVETDPLFGLPKPRSGQMASVYKLSAGRRTWAVRCFTLETSDRATRYAAIADFLARNTNRYTVGFEYLERGIVVDAVPYPVVKMDWVEGELLLNYIEKHLTAPDVLERLLRDWVEMVRYLRVLGLAHGDLQHGNVLVTHAGALKLIDYDGMFVPELAGRPSAEMGHPNYQHPCRRARDFGPQLDDFSSWVVFLSIAALSRDSTLWDTLGYGDECLAFRSADYVRPSASAAFALLKDAADPRVARVARLLESMLSHEPLLLPALEDVVHAGGDGAPWRLSSFGGRPLERGLYSEPFLIPVNPDVTGKAPRKPARELPAWSVRAGAGVAASIAGYWVFASLGFATNEYLAVISLGWLLAAILAIASSNATPRGGSRP